MQLDEAVCDVRVVVEVRVAARAPVPARTQQSPVLAGQRPEQKLPYATSSLEPVVAVETVGRFGERREREPVPRREDLVVAERLGTRRALGEHACAQLRLELAADDEPAVLEGLEQLGRQPDGVGLFRRPGECEPLHAVRVRILRRSQPTLRERQFPQDVVERLLDHLAVARLPGDDPRVQVRRRQHGVVVEHLLEVRHEPAVVHRVAVEATSTMSYMPPAAIPSSVAVTMASEPSSPRRSKNSSVEAAGNFGARPNPPKAGSNVPAIPRAPSDRSDEVRGSADGGVCATLRSASAMRLAWRSMSSRRSLQVCETARSTSSKLGRP